MNELDKTRVWAAQITLGIKTPNEIRMENGLKPLNYDFMNTPYPVWQQKMAESMKRGW